MHDKIVISLLKTSILSHLTTSIIQSSVSSETPCAWMTALALRLIPPVSRRIYCCGSCRHSRCNAASNWGNLNTGGSTACTRQPSMSPTCSIGFKLRRSHGFTLKVGSYSTSTMRHGVVIHMHMSCRYCVVVEIGNTNWL